MLTLCGDVLNFKSSNSVPDDNQLWYRDDQPDGSFMIVCKRNKKVLTYNSENESKIVIHERCGDESQKWLEENGTIISLKHNALMCEGNQDSQAICVPKMAEYDRNRFSCLQPSVSYSTKQFGFKLIVYTVWC